MDHQDNLKIQYRLDHPLASREFSINQYDKLRIRIAAVSTSNETDPRALVCCVRFLDEQSKLIDGNYQGAFFSPIYGQFVFIPSHHTSEEADWLKKALVAPEKARTLQLTILEWEANAGNLKPIKHIECVPGNLPILESSFSIKPEIPTKLTLFFSQRINEKNCALVAVTYYDCNDDVLDPSYSDLAFSQRYGYFRYISRTFSSNKFEACLIAPKNASQVRIRVYSLKKLNDLSCSRAPKLDIYPTYLNAEESSQWQRLKNLDSVEISLPQIATKSELHRIELSYIAHSRLNMGNGKLEIEFLNENNDSIQKSPAFEQLCDSKYEIEQKTFYLYCPVKTKTIRLKFHFDDLAILYTKQKISIKNIKENIEIQQLRIQPQKKMDLQSCVFPFWSTLLFLSVSNENQIVPKQGDFDISFIFFDTNGNAMESEFEQHRTICGVIVQGDNSSYRLLPYESDTELNPVLNAIVQLVPPALATRLSVRISNNAKTAALQINHEFLPYGCIIHNRIEANSYKFILENKKLPNSIAQEMLTCIVKKYPTDQLMLEHALDIYAYLGDAPAFSEIGARILSSANDPSVRQKARLALSKAKSLDVSWSPSMELTGSVSKKSNRKPKTKNYVIANFIDTTCIGNSAEYQARLLDIQKNDNAIKIFAVTPLGYPDIGTSGSPWEIIENDDFSVFHLNCVSSEQLKTVPLTTQIEFSVLLAAKILGDQRANLIHTNTTNLGYVQALVSLTLSQILGIPFVLDVREETEFNRELSQLFVEASSMQQLRCAQQANAIITHSESMKNIFLDKKISPEKIFEAPHYNNAYEYAIKKFYMQKPGYSKD